MSGGVGVLPAHMLLPEQASPLKEHTARWHGCRTAASCSPNDTGRNSLSAAASASSGTSTTTYRGQTHEVSAAGNCWQPAFMLRVTSHQWHHGTHIYTTCSHRCANGCLVIKQKADSAGAGSGSVTHRAVLLICTTMTPAAAGRPAHSGNRSLKGPTGAAP